MWEDGSSKGNGGTVYSSSVYLGNKAKRDKVDKHFWYLCPDFFQDVHEMGVVVISSEGGEVTRAAECNMGGGGGNMGGGGVTWEGEGVMGGGGGNGRRRG